MREVTVRTRIKWAAKHGGLKSTISNKMLRTLPGVRTQGLGVLALCSFLVWMVDFINCVHIEYMVKFRVSRTVFWKCYQWKIINKPWHEVLDIAKSLNYESGKYSILTTCLIVSEVLQLVTFPLVFYRW